VRHDADGKPMSKVYVKVYGRSQDGQVKFFKDGYTDLRGRFDYVSVSGWDGASVDRYAILVMHDEGGATITELAPPVR
jgi:5-hydroxyisourate hydrolase-like protein (transthyretin family)